MEEFAKTLAGRKGSPQPINLLVHNAGVMAVDDERTEDGFETTFQVNHLAPFLLTLRLLPCLRAASTATRSRPPPIATLSAAATFQSGGLEVGGDEGKGGQSSALDGWGRGVRVVWVSSGAHKWGSVPGRPGVGVRGSQEQEGDGGRVTGLFGIAFNQRRGMLGRWRAYADSKLLNAMIAAEVILIQ